MRLFALYSDDGIYYALSFQDGKLVPGGLFEYFEHAKRCYYELGGIDPINIEERWVRS